jgi:uncharacterized protein YprB with RNaseH-like and TPR domain
MLNQINIENILFIDIETIPEYPDYSEMPDNFKMLWDKKAEFLKRDDNDTPDILYCRAGIYSEFGKIICISAGFFRNEEFRIKSFFGDDEKFLLNEFAELLNTHYNTRKYLLCAHNGKEFDFPYLSRRMLINNIKLPDLLNMSGKKPWEIPHLDTMELWKFGDYKHYTSLELLATVFNIPTPKDDIKGSDVAQVYWDEKDLQRIVKYCQKDVITIAQIMLKYQRKPFLQDENIKEIT